MKSSVIGSNDVSDEAPPPQRIMKVGVSERNFVLNHKCNLRRIRVQCKDKKTKHTRSKLLLRFCNKRKTRNAVCLIVWIES